ncbi:PREDICTED: uncharacterized protein LOC104601298 [Nelumbo nucifera]|uniref:Uncharacterized protein LOC104601298 n=1 Tax=Nelumbo nucifera TaxID=4432 RepID=A0A1U8AKR2_NELNU|nr:PREDICTED: uncharacterized protein LOC104601298 [Nelumbo nucifera]
MRMRESHLRWIVHVHPMTASMRWRDLLVYPSTHAKTYTNRNHIQPALSCLAIKQKAYYSFLREKQMQAIELKWGSSSSSYRRRPLLSSLCRASTRLQSFDWSRFSAGFLATNLNLLSATQVLGGDADGPIKYLVIFDEKAARYLSLPMKLVLWKKRAKEGRSSDEVEHYPIPSRVTVRCRPEVAAIELQEAGDLARPSETPMAMGDSQDYSLRNKRSRSCMKSFSLLKDPHDDYENSKGNVSSSKRGTSTIEDGLVRQHKLSQLQDMDHSSGAEDDISE